MASSSPLSGWENFNFERDLPKAKPTVAKIFLEYIRSDGSIGDHRPEQPCGIWLIGALTISLADVVGINPLSPAAKKSKLGPTTESDSHFLTALLRFVVQTRSETEMRDLFARLDSRDGCYCSKVEDIKLGAKEYLSVHTPHDIGRSMMESYRKSGHFLPLIQKVSFTYHVQTLPPSAIRLRGRRSPHADMQAHQYLPPICRPDRLRYASPAISFFTIVFGSLATVLESRTSLSFSKGGAKNWPFSPREFLLLVRDPASNSAPTGSSDDTAACALDLMSAIQEWSYWMPNTSPTLLLTRIVDMCGTLLVPAVVEYSYSITTLTDLARDIIYGAMTTLREIDCAEPSLSHFSSRKAVGLFVVEQCDMIANYYWMMMSRRGVPFGWNDTLLPDNCLKITQIFTIMMYLLEDSRIPLSIQNSDRAKQVKESMRHLCFTYHSMARLLSHGQGVPYPGIGMVCHPRLARHYADVRERNDPDEMAIVDPQINSLDDTASSDRARFVDMLPNIRKQTYCCAWGCSTSVQEVGAEFKACSACGITKYCGRACQKLDWKGFTSSGDPLADTQLHHSKICTLLKKFSMGSSDKDASANEVILEDRDWRILATWTNALYPPDGELPPHQALEELSSPNTQSEEFMLEWEDFSDILLEFVVLASAPEPVSITWLPMNRN